MNNAFRFAASAVPYQEFARLIGKTPAAVRGMIEKGKLPVHTQALAPAASPRKCWASATCWHLHAAQGFAAVCKKQLTGSS
ncbi:Cox family DNA-binding protein [Enterobacter sp. Bisph1]|uniref:Cox family DNA-binding protein n=1 Tax=Enterobacter sp. Bisph1 TaxID=1274399 RepID=UPI0012E00F31|nr:Cox family DNA-binding protein [Enterobacter sp. Bisph1]